MDMSSKGKDRGKYLSRQHEVFKPCCWGKESVGSWERHTVQLPVDSYYLMNRAIITLEHEGNLLYNDPDAVAWNIVVRKDFFVKEQLFQAISPCKESYIGVCEPLLIKSNRDGSYLHLNYDYSMTTTDVYSWLEMGSKRSNRGQPVNVNVETPDIEEIPERKFNFSSWIWSDRRPTQRDNISNVIVELIVKGIPKDSSLVDVQLHFCLKTNGGCGDVRSVSWEPIEPDCHTKTARVTFEHETTVRTVWSFPHHINGEKLELSIVGSEQFEAPIDDPESLLSEKELAKCCKGPPIAKRQLPLSTVGYLADDDMFDRNTPEGGNNDVPMWSLGPNRYELDLIRHVTRICYKMSRPTAKNTKKARNAATAGLKLELGQIREILKTEMIPKLNSIDSVLKETAAKERAEFERTKEELSAKMKQLESSEAEMITLRQNLSDLQADCTLAQENTRKLVKISQEKVAKLNASISQLQQTATQERAEFDRIKGELSDEMVVQLEKLKSLETELTQVKQNWTESQSTIELAQEKEKIYQSEIAKLKTAIDDLQQTVNRGTKDLEKSDHIRAELNEKIDSQKDQLESLKWEVGRLTQDWSESKKSLSASQEEIAKLRETVTRGTKDLTESERIRAELNEKIDIQQQQMEFLTSEVVRLERDWSESQSKLLSSQKSLSISQDVNSQLQEKLKSSHDRVVKMVDFNEKISAVTMRAFGRKAELDKLCADVTNMLASLKRPGGQQE